VVIHLSFNDSELSRIRLEPETDDEFSRVGSFYSRLTPGIHQLESVLGHLLTDEAVTA